MVFFHRSRLGNEDTLHLCELERSFQQRLRNISQLVFRNTGNSLLIKSWCHSSNELKWEDYNVGPNALKNVVQRTIGHISEHTPPDEAKVVTRGQSKKANAPKNEKKSAPQTRMNVNPENPPDHANLRNAYRVPVKNTYSILGDLNTMRANISIASFIRVAPTRAYFNIQYCQPSVRWGLPVTNKGVYLLD